MISVPSHSAHPKAARAKPRPWYTSLHFQVLIAIIIGVALGIFAPAQAVALKPISDAFIKILRMMLTPVIFFTVVIGIGSTGDLKKVGRIGAKALIYFEAGTTLALLIGLIVVHVAKPGAGLNIDPATLDAKALSAYTHQATNHSFVDYLTGIIPEGAGSPFVNNEILQVLFLGILVGMALAHVGQESDILHRGMNQINGILYKIVDYLMQVSPLAALAAMAFTVGQYGLRSLVPLLSLIVCFYVTSALFVFIVLGAVCRFCGISIWKFLKYLKEELLVVLATSASTPVLPSLMLKLERLGCSKTTAGFVVPAGTTFNLDGASIYLTMAFVFLAQATNTPLTWGTEAFVLGVMLLTSKGSAGVPGGGFITLAATLAAVHSVPIAALALLLGVDRFMSQARALVNVIGNGVATIVVARWEGEFDLKKARAVLDRKGGDLAVEEPAEAVAGE